MRFVQVARRVTLFLLVNWLVMLTVGVIVGLFFHGVAARYGYGYIFTWCFLIGMGGAFVSLALSRWMAVWRMGVQIIDPENAGAEERQLVDIVHRLAKSAGLPALPDVGIYDSPEVNAFATGPSRHRALVAVSSGLLRHMQASDIEGVLGHEITHVVNGDMVTMTVIQGVVNTLAQFLAFIVANFLSRGSSRDDERGGGGSFFMQYMLYNLMSQVFFVLGSLVVMWFSRWREYRADAGGARLAGKARMISALRALEAVHNAGADMAGQRQPAFAALKVSGRTTSLFGLLFADHPPIEERIARLEQLPD